MLHKVQRLVAASAVVLFLFGWSETSRAHTPPIPTVESGQGAIKENRSAVRTGSRTPLRTLKWKANTVKTLVGPELVTRSANIERNLKRHMTRFMLNSRTRERIGNTLEALEQLRGALPDSTAGGTSLKALDAALGRLRLFRAKYDSTLPLDGPVAAMQRLLKERDALGEELEAVVSYFAKHDPKFDNGPLGKAWSEAQRGQRMSSGAFANWFAAEPARDNFRGVADLHDLLLPTRKQSEMVGFEKLVEELKLPDLKTQAHVRVAPEIASEGLGVYVDLGRLRYAIQSLLSNARTALKGKKPTISVAIGPEGRPVVQVDDRGPGIEASILNRATNILEGVSRRGESGGLVEHPPTDGDGLGLPTALLLLEMGRAKVSVETERGKGHGTVWTITLPTAADATDHTLQ